MNWSTKTSCDKLDPFKKKGQIQILIIFTNELIPHQQMRSLLLIKTFILEIFFQISNEFKYLLVLFGLEIYIIGWIVCCELFSCIPM
jgi:hypothetical protein